jgi:small redox-active disulfide protein 2
MLAQISRFRRKKMNIKILGPGCARCHELDKMTREIVNELGLDADVEYVKDLNEIIKYGILITPGLVVNGKVVCSGHVPGKDEITRLLTSAADRT